MTPGESSIQATQRDYKERMLRVLVYIQQHLDHALELEDLARVACFSPYHFHRIFTGMIGETVKAHIRRLRLERAASQLKHEQQPVLDIALTAGYETHEAFTRAFRASFKMAPSQYRATKKPTPSLKAPSQVHWDGPLNNFRTSRSGLHTMKVEIKTLQPMRVAFMRHLGPYQEVGVTWEKLCLALGKEGLLGGGTRFIGVSYDDPEVTPQEKIRYDACITVDEHFAATGDIGVQTLPGGLYAMTTHFGSYDTLGRTYAQLFGKWLPRSGRKLGAGPCCEMYLNSPENTEPEDLLTDIYLPLEPERPV